MRAKELIAGCVGAVRSAKSDEVRDVVDTHSVRTPWQGGRAELRLAPKFANPGEEAGREHRDNPFRPDSGV